jgi:two-component system CheB/CheR fusion protein
VLRLGKLDGERLDKALATMERQVTHLTRLVDDLLDVSRITRGLVELKRAPVELAAVVGQAVEMARAAVESRGHELLVTLPARAVRLEADPTRLTQVLFNLLNNAAKYTEPGGRIWLAAERDGNAVELRVRDTGVGIGPELLPKVFDLFTQGERTLDRAQGGLGLGLTLVKRLVEMHGGTVTARSAGPGAGSEFTVRLPALPAGPAEQPPAPSAAPAPAARPARVLVVDDNPDVAESVAMLLVEGLGHEVKVAHSGPQALELAREFRPEAVLLDIGLPGMDGYEVARRLRQLPGADGALLVALSGYGQEEDRRRSREAGFDEHLLKPAGWATLQPVLARLGTGRPTG